MSPKEEKVIKRIVSLSESTISELLEELFEPEMACADCGYCGPDFRTINHAGPIDSPDYDCECMSCGSTDTHNLKNYNYRL